MREDDADLGGAPHRLRPVRKWEMKSEMKEARFYFGCCAFENKSIYVFGGMNENLVL
jgi:hypothetical protein